MKCKADTSGAGLLGCMQPWRKCNPWCEFAHVPPSPAERLSQFMRLVDAYAADYAKDGKLAPSRAAVERAAKEMKP